MGLLDEVIVISDDEEPSPLRRSKRLKTGVLCAWVDINCLLSAGHQQHYRLEHLAHIKQRPRA